MRTKRRAPASPASRPTCDRMRCRRRFGGRGPAGRARARDRPSPPAPPPRRAIVGPRRPRPSGAPPRARRHPVVVPRRSRARDPRPRGGDDPRGPRRDPRGRTGHASGDVRRRPPNPAQPVRGRAGRGQPVRRAPGADRRRCRPARHARGRRGGRLAGGNPSPSDRRGDRDAAPIRRGRARCPSRAELRSQCLAWHGRGPRPLRRTRPGTHRVATAARGRGHRRIRPATRARPRFRGLDLVQGGRGGDHAPRPSRI